MVIGALAPLAEQRFDAYSEGRKLEVEEVHGLRALVRCRQWVYGRAVAAAEKINFRDGDGLPWWLSAPLTAMQMSQAELNAEKQRIMKAGVNSVGAAGSAKEYVSRETLFRESTTEIHADHIVTTSSKLRSLLYKIY